MARQSTTSTSSNSHMCTTLRARVGWMSSMRCVPGTSRRRVGGGGGVSGVRLRVLQYRVESGQGAYASVREDATQNGADAQIEVLSE